MFGHFNYDSEELRDFAVERLKFVVSKITLNLSFLKSKYLFLFLGWPYIDWNELKKRTIPWDVELFFNIAIEKFLQFVIKVICAI